MNRLRATTVVMGLLTACGMPAVSGVDGSVADPDAGVDGGAAADGGSDAGSPPVDAGAGPIIAAADQWTWVDFPDSKCASGTPTGIGVNPHAGATDLLIYLEGGGACSSGPSCWGPTPTANNLTGYDATTFATARQRAYPVLQRALAANPFKAMNLVYVPYCTGDLHAGTREVDLPVGSTVTPTYFWGATDMELFLSRLVPTFPSVQRVWVLGTSAGGYGSFLLFDRVARAFQTRVDVVDDSGPALVFKGATDNQAAYTQWGFQAPAGCSPCSKHADVLAFDRASQPNSRFAFLSFDQDVTIAPDYGYTLAEYPAVLSAFTSSFAGDVQAKSFVVTNKAAHVVESDPVLIPDYLPWLGQMVSDDPAWASVTFVHP